MAKISMVNRDKKRARLTQKYAARRAELKARIKDASLSFEERYEAQLALQKLPRDSSPVRGRSLRSVTIRSAVPEGRARMAPTMAGASFNRASRFVTRLAETPALFVTSDLVLASPEASVRCHCSACSSSRTMRGGSVGCDFARFRRFRSMTSREGSTITSLRGDVTVHFPAQGGCLVEASAGYGRIESDLETVRVSEDGARASGMVNRRSRPTVRVESAGSVVLAGPYSAAE